MGHERHFAVARTTPSQKSILDVPEMHLARDPEKWWSKNFFFSRAEPFIEWMIQLIRWPTERGGFSYEHVRPFPEICR